MTNKELARQQHTTPRQISKSRKRGWITLVGELNGNLMYGERVKYTAPPPVFITKPRTEKE